MILSFQPQVRSKSPKLAFSSQNQSSPFSSLSADTASLRFGTQTSQGAWPGINRKVARCGQTLLNKAAYEGNRKQVKCLLKAGANPNIPNTDGITPLMWAISYKNAEELVPLFLKRGAKVNHQSKSGATALNWAILKGRLKVVQALLDAGADPNLHYPEEASPLHHATEEGVEPEIMQALLRHGASVNARMGEGETPLHWLVQESGDIVKLKLLLDAGADPLIEDYHGTMPLEIALRNHKPKIAQRLLESKHLRKTTTSKTTACKPQSHLAQAGFSGPITFR